MQKGCSSRFSKYECVRVGRKAGKPGVANTYAGKYNLVSPQVSKNRKVVFNDRFNSMKFVENSCVPQCLPFGQNIHGLKLSKGILNTDISSFRDSFALLSAVSFPIIPT